MSLIISVSVSQMLTAISLQGQSIRIRVNIY